MLISKLNCRKYAHLLTVCQIAGPPFHLDNTVHVKHRQQHQCPLGTNPLSASCSNSIWLKILHNAISGTKHWSYQAFSQIQWYSPPPGSWIGRHIWDRVCWRWRHLNLDPMPLHRACQISTSTFAWNWHPQQGTGHITIWTNWYWSWHHFAESQNVAYLIYVGADFQPMGRLIPGDGHWWHGIVSSPSAMALMPSGLWPLPICFSILQCRHFQIIIIHWLRRS